jgi:site-specific DNA recombinase
MKTAFAYIRVSTPRQGEKGVSLKEQQDAILRYAQRNALRVTEWFEERETAAARGRPIFGRMLKLLRGGKASGVIIHKVDRGARNLKDWADLGDLIDQGIDVYFANEDLDLHSRGGRLSADIQAVVASDYIRNLREETKKGFYGRLKQGLYPRPAPIGYQDVGEGKPKVPDPAQAPLIAKAFELYASRRYTLPMLVEEMFRLGLRTKGGSKVVKNSLNNLLHNPFYMGVIHIKRTGDVFTGVHRLIISKWVFDEVQSAFKGKSFRRTQRYDFLFRRLLKCSSCRRSLIGETHKGHVYYRCHHRGGKAPCIREDAVQAKILQTIWPLETGGKEMDEVLTSEVLKMEEHSAKMNEGKRPASNCALVTTKIGLTGSRMHTLIG